MLWISKRYHEMPREKWIMKHVIDQREVCWLPSMTVENTHRNAAGSSCHLLHMEHISSVSNESSVAMPPKIRALRLEARAVLRVISPIFSRIAEEDVSRAALVRTGADLRQEDSERLEPNSMVRAGLS
jgi:hypothetical protein